MKEFDELDSALKNLKAETVDKFIAWFWKLRYAKFIFIFLGSISCAYILTSFYLTFN